MFIMSIDLESWLHRPIFGVPIERQTKLEDSNFIPAAVEILLERLARFKAKATFFCLGTVAEWYPDVIREIATQGHELAVHGYTHRFLHVHTRQSFEHEIEKTQDILAEFAERPIGFRASTCTYAPFLYEVLENYGFRYDSSILPIRTPLYDWSMYKDSMPFWVTPGLLEIPLSIYRFGGVRLPVGGFYLRLLGASMNVRLLRRVERRFGIGIFYIHPWEILSNPRVPVSLPKRVLAHHRIPALEAFEKVLQSFVWTSFRDSLEVIGRELAMAVSKDGQKSDGWRRQTMGGT
jgi:polysaccharide deacetylase family protein (PEP-CTERM system associated)